MKNCIQSYIFCFLFIITVFLLFLAMDGFPMDRMLEKSKPYLSKLNFIINEKWDNISNRYYIAGQIEKESRWQVNAELKTSREYGFGLSQITITERFNNFKTATEKYRALKDWKFEDRYNPTYQMTYIVLEDKNNFYQMKKLFSTIKDTWAGTLVCYNAGKGTVLQRRALCKKTDNCNWTIWFGGLDSVKIQYESRKLYGRDLGDMRNDYPYSIINKLSDKYKELMCQTESC